LLIGSKKHASITTKSCIYALALLFVLISWHSVKASTDRQFDTQFPSTDLAGQYLNTHATMDERIFMGQDPSGQTVATLWYAKRYGQWMPANLTEFKRWENDLGFKWIFLYGLQDSSGHRNALITMEAYKQQYPELWGYINSTYDIAQVGVVKSNQGGIPYYFILKKGGSLNLTRVLERPQVLGEEYEFSFGKLQMFTFSIG
jgi:hypothetical protein